MSASTADEPRPPRLTLDSPIRCERLRGVLSARCCVLRQLVAASGRTRQTSRGQGPLYPSCDGCPQGVEVRAAAEGAAALRWRGAGPGGRFAREREDGAAQEAARRRLELAGMLDDAPTLDAPPMEDELGDVS
ncbi:hypothetical protein [Anaeromyxobacter terrae]|uniref:hypothetical protein n=1 Tax=Anaeromyxobacter terrae TaxID=2925406 RepID=UPI001F5AAFFD|nr:hypothetical protein [Anaeromyxobacter sp. SG22]